MRGQMGLMWKSMAAGACAAVMLAGATRGETLQIVEDFNHVCVGMTDLEDAWARAKVLGYVTAPEEMRRRGDAPKEAIVLVRTTEEAITLIILLRQRLPGRGAFLRAMSTDVCSTHSMTKHQDINQRLETLLGVGDAQRVIGMRNSYVYAQRPGGRERVTATRDTIDRLAGVGSLRMGFASLQGGATVMLMAPRPEVKAAK